MLPVKLHPHTQLPRLFTVALCLLLGLIVGCAQQSNLRYSGPANAPTEKIISLTDDNQDGMPEGWRKLLIRADKTRTVFTPIRKDGMDVVQADAESSASGLHFNLRVDSQASPWIGWHWKVANLITQADITQRSKEDSPVRLILGFDGDKTKLPFKEQMLLNMGKVMAGHEVPYATLVYVWDNQQPQNTHIPHAVTDRIKMIVVESGDSKLGQWQHYMRNYAADYEKAYGEKPGPLISIGILSDTDNTGDTARAWYGPLSISQQPLRSPHLP
ncbi:DUF3047 domain-containing protein [Parvibium lacunae]|nr:DUF3047 domain-containing protein [Parvibium lacunae]